MNKIKITPEFLADLKAKAEKATPGPWGFGTYDIDSDTWGVGYFEDNDTNPIAGFISNTSLFPLETVATNINGENNAVYLSAANPQLVLAMIAHIENLEKELDAARYSEANESGRVVRLERESDWLASRLQKFCDHTLVCMSCPCRLRGGCHNNNWRNAARKAVEDADDAMEAEQEARER